MRAFVPVSYSWVLCLALGTLGADGVSSAVEGGCMSVFSWDDSQSFRPGRFVMSVSPTLYVGMIDRSRVFSCNTT